MQDHGLLVQRHEALTRPGSEDWVLCVRQDPLLTAFGVAPLLWHAVASIPHLQEKGQRPLAMRTRRVFVEVAALPHLGDQLLGRPLLEMDKPHNGLLGCIPHVDLGVRLLLVLGDIIGTGGSPRHALRQ